MRSWIKGISWKHAMGGIGFGSLMGGSIRRCHSYAAPLTSSTSQPPFTSTSENQPKKISHRNSKVLSKCISIPPLKYWKTNKQKPEESKGMLWRRWIRGNLSRSCRGCIEGKGRRRRARRGWRMFWRWFFRGGWGGKGKLGNWKKFKILHLSGSIWLEIPALKLLKFKSHYTCSTTQISPQKSL